MMPSTVLPAGVSRWRVVVFAVVAAVFVGLATLIDGPVDPVLAAMGLLTLVYMAAGAVDTVREHPAFPLASAVYTTFLFAGGYVSGALSNLLWAVLAVLSAFGVVVEAYNYRHGTSYLRLDFE
ncbi:phosphatidate cytidylyltransferase [Haloferax volcanii]|uniref:phosphatidate cytidylyltransferase n=1 Tax=Haloferax volcanii TaxID=2246 RepID=UPI0023DA71E5|nr:phosphatidate cytidylyltransferase [Haloferax lucentense]WEL27736.1 putative membrane protein [Haloferax lucentense]